MISRNHQQTWKIRKPVAERPNDLLDLIKEEGLFRDADDERGWLLPYIDVVTLLLSLFVIMVAMQDLQAQAKTESKANGEMPELIIAEKTVEEQLMEELVAEEQIVEEQVLAAEESHQEKDPSEAVDQESQAIGEEFQEVISREGLDDLVDVQVEQSRVKLQIRDSILFPLAAAGLTNEGFTVLDKIIPVINDNPFRLSIEGHTDSLPIQTNLFPSNWELSSARASTVLRMLVQRGVDSRRLRAVGYADTLPMESNDSIDGRAANRRVSIVVFLGEKDWLESEEL